MHLFSGFRKFSGFRLNPLNLLNPLNRLFQARYDKIFGPLTQFKEIQQLDIDAPVKAGSPCFCGLFYCLIFKSSKNRSVSSKLGKIVVSSKLAVCCEAMG